MVAAACSRPSWVSLPWLPPLPSAASPPVRQKAIPSGWGVIAGAEEEIAEVVKQVAARDGLDVRIITFQDYVLPNEALAAGDLDANAFQHQPYLDAQIAAHGYDIVNVGYTIVEPIGIYSTKVKTLARSARGREARHPERPVERRPGAESAGA